MYGVGIVLTSLGLVVLGLWWLTHSERGRAELSDFGLTQLNAMLPGTVHVERIAQLGLRAVELRGVRIDDPTGSEVIAVDHVRVELQPWRALYGEIVASQVVISGARVDLRQIGEKRRGLLAAFVEPDQPESPPSGTVPPHVRVSHVTLTHGFVRLPELAALGQLDLTSIEIEGAYELREGESLVDLQKLSCAAERDGEALARLERATGRLPRAPEPVTVSLQAWLQQTKLVLTARGPIPWEKDADSAALDAKLELSDVLPGELAGTLRPPVVLPELRGAVSATLALQGSARKLQARLALQTAGGSAQLSANLRDFAHASWIFESSSLDPTRVLPDLGLPQPFAIGARLTGTAELPSDGAIAASVDGDLELNGRHLPRTTASARLQEGALRDVKLSVVDAYSKVTLEGELAADGAVRAALRLNLDARTVREAASSFGRVIPEARGVVAGRLELEHGSTTRIAGSVTSDDFESGPVSLHEFALTADMRGRLPGLSGSAELRLGSGKLSELELRDIALAVAGGPSHWTLTSAATLPDRASGALRLAVRELSERGVTVSGSGEGKLMGEPWRLDLQSTRAQTSGRIDTQGVSVHLADQELRARGRWSAAQSELELHGRGLDLARLLALAKRLAPAAVAELPT
ncbi:MAG TPA: hypothetical protein VJV78_32290, partial [Polyangiales bacterium]|nr:hypothetical protein [Polyangiales bacterium]